MPFKNPEAHREWWANRRAEVRQIIQTAKEKPCADCGGYFHFAAMQFDHTEKNKKFNIGSATAAARSIQALKDEIAKCEVVCANCHSVRTFNRGYFSRHDA